jgi:hypothetical protein
MKQILKLEFERGGALQKLLLRYTQALMTQMSQTAVCNRHHCVEQQLCRWLLLTLDRLEPNHLLSVSSAAPGADRELVITQELIANMLGVRREGITEAAGKLQAARKALAAWTCRSRTYQFNRKFPLGNFRLVFGLRVFLSRLGTNQGHAFCKRDKLQSCAFCLFFGPLLQSFRMALKFVCHFRRRFKFSANR